MCLKDQFVTVPEGTDRQWLSPAQWRGRPWGRAPSPSSLGSPEATKQSALLPGASLGFLWNADAFGRCPEPARAFQQAVPFHPVVAEGNPLITSDPSLKIPQFPVGIIGVPIFPYFYPYRSGTKKKTRLPASQIPSPSSSAVFPCPNLRKQNQMEKYSAQDKRSFLLWPLLRYEKRQMNPLVRFIMWRIAYFIHSPYSLLFKLFLSEISTSKS